MCIRDRVKAVYEQGESNPTNTECGSVTDPGDFSIVTIDSQSVESGSQVVVNISADNQFPVAGFQFTISDYPNILTALSAETTDRSEGFTLQFNEQEDGSVIVVGFNITGGLIDVGNGSVMELTYQASTVLSETIVDLNMLEFYLGDISGSAIPAFSQNGQITITPAGAQLLSVSDLELSSGEQGNIEISLNNDIPIAGFQFTLSDYPDLLTLIQAEATDRTSSFSVQANQVGNDVIILGFSFTGDLIAPGSGPIVNTTFLSSGSVGTSTLSLSDITLSDTNGQEVPVSSSSGLVNVIEAEILGCTDSSADNYNPDANITIYDINPTQLEYSKWLNSKRKYPTHDEVDAFVKTLGKISVSEKFEEAVDNWAPADADYVCVDILETKLSCPTVVSNILKYMPVYYKHGSILIEKWKKDNSGFIIEAK